MEYYNTKIAADGLPAFLSVCVGDFGFSAGSIPQKIKATCAPRGDCGGWTAGVSSRLHSFLMSVLASSLSGYGYAITLTFRDCPLSARDMHRVRRSFIRRLERRGLLRLLWVCEFQRRGVPHFHIAAYFGNGIMPADIIALWCKCAAKYKVKRTAQTCVDINDIGGWFGYMQTHVVRGIKHYQRQRDNLPPDWQNNTGRVWGHVGDWQTDVFQLLLSDKQKHKLFLLRDCELKLQLADAREVLAKLGGSHFRFIRQTGKMPGYVIRAICMMSGVYSPRVADKKQRGARIGIKHSRSGKKVALPHKIKEQLELQLAHLHEHVARGIVGYIKSRFSERRGIRGSHQCSRMIVSNVMRYDRAYKIPVCDVKQRLLEFKEKREAA